MVRITKPDVQKGAEPSEVALPDVKATPEIDAKASVETEGFERQTKSRVPMPKHQVVSSPTAVRGGLESLSKTQLAVGNGLRRDLETATGERRNVLAGAYAIWLSENGLSREDSQELIVHGASRTDEEAAVEHKALEGLIDSVKDRVASGKDAWVIVDIDDTLLDSRARTTYTARVIGEQFDMDCLRGAVDGEQPKKEAFKAIHDEWLAKGRDADKEVELHQAFIQLNDGLAYHPQAALRIAGSDDYLKRLDSEGAKFLFLTARVEPERNATKDQLRDAGYPVKGHQIVTRDDAGVAAHVFKQSVIEAHPSREDFVGALDDDGRNHEVFAAAAPHAQQILVDVQGEASAEGATVIRDFTRAR